MNKNIIRKRRIFLYVLVFFVFSISFFLAVGRCAYLIRKNYFETLGNNLGDVSRQNAEALTDQIKVRYQLLNSITKRFEMEPDSRKDNLYLFEPVAEAFGLKRIGFCDSNGICYATQGEEQNLSYREFFKRSMNGEIYISDVLKDAMDPNHTAVTVMSMPIHGENGQIEGVCGITYETENLIKDIIIETFEGAGITCVFNEKGNINISSHENLFEVNDNIYDILWGEMGKNYDNRNQLIDELIEGGDEGNNKVYGEGILSIKGDRYFYHIEPVYVLDGNTKWHILSMVPYSYFEQRFARTRNNLMGMVLVIMLFVIATFFIFQLINFRQWKQTNKSAYTSPLTGGANSVRMKMILGRYPYTEGFMVAMNIENWRHTSLALGTIKTEALLKDIWKILAENERSEDFFCHVNNDNFFMYMNLPSEVELKKRILMLQMLIREEAIIKHHSSWINPKFGVCAVHMGESVEETMSKAELAIQYALGTENTYAFYDEERQQYQIENQEYEDHFKQALIDREFQIYFQPKYGTKDKKLTGCEALVRWNFKNKEMVRPDRFIPLLEHNGKINRLDEYVFRRVCEYQRDWKKAGLEVVPVSVNLSKNTLFRPRIVEHYMEIMKSYGVEPNEIQLEVTETLVASGNNMPALLNAFREKGIKILMDDFGTGYTALSVLNKQCFDTIKIDKSLIDGINDEYGAQLIESVIQMNQKLGYYVTAEGVEEEYQFDFLKENHCNDIQGYFFAKPEPADVFQTRLLSA